MLGGIARKRKVWVKVGLKRRKKDKGVLRVCDVLAYVG
jgi:hypothetical protein